MAIFISQSAVAGIPIEHWALDNGAQVYLVRSPGIPMVDVQLDFDGGSRRDPASQAGLASVTASQLSAGVRAAAGQKALDENALGEAWADLGASFGAGATGDRLSVSLRSLSYPDLLERAVQLAAHELAHPAYPQTVWERERKKLEASLKEAETRPATVAGRAFGRAVYGSHPYGYEMTAATLAAIRVEDMQRHHAATVLPCRAKVSIVGALDRAQADAVVRQLLQWLPQGACPALPAVPAVPEVAPLQQASEQRIPFDAAQAQVLLGQPGFKRNDPDFLALNLANHVLGGGGFTSRLTEEVREKRGLTYSVYSYFSPALHAGAFTVGLQTRPDQAEQALTVVREVLERFTREGPTQAELDAAKANMVGGFALLLDSNKKLLGQVANIAWNGLPLDYLDTWQARVQAIPLEQVKAAFARVVNPQRMATVVLGATPPKATP
ncbi:pitrilysin family protein [Curvibacter sp. APW13]|uniref:M16 family metallopeptidase n=1 Tax=Curvibacter sp. APW13 TaxID=3077236 RepID=UPI0028DE0A0D|nr:pitrilysin family protein [Curvibacter sp. APW13]MDT8992473.1 pitrilysin family protein [Curvibacter sp. APW13]